MTQCSCIDCPACKGNGYIWEDVYTHQLHKSRCNDDAEMVDCPDCDGEGVDYFCDYCRERYENDNKEV